MTKKDYELIARLIRLNTDSQDKDYLHKLNYTIDLTVALQLQNPKFDRNKFLEACGLESEV